MNSMTSLVPEWERIDLLGTSLAAYRSGVDIPKDVGTRLGVLQPRGPDRGRRGSLSGSQVEGLAAG